ncbi:unnamed protein product [Chondrus crispus]|uniref:Uncharacterized protein n=1 Tax=Chondrus crispus TaxID=2769 RepID=R7QC40_CHOCR|nr:unnamed protein product [Chondrus crispus]CDF35363.1 unnamed protein product [Chondrus crispus]|eukprot:XP_005715182.1 unnamed protein product [Chondrus crispus]
MQARSRDGGGGCVAALCDWRLGVPPTMRGCARRPLACPPCGSHCAPAYNAQSPPLRHTLARHLAPPTPALVPAPPARSHLHTPRFYFRFSTARTMPFALRPSYSLGTCPAHVPACPAAIHSVPPHPLSVPALYKSSSFPPPLASTPVAQPNLDLLHHAAIEKIFRPQTTPLVVYIATALASLVAKRPNTSHALRPRHETRPHGRPLPLRVPRRLGIIRRRRRVRKDAARPLRHPRTRRREGGVHAEGQRSRGRRHRGESQQD